MGKQALEDALVFVADTHALVFALIDSPTLGKKAKEIFKRAEKKEVKIVFSIITLLELISLCEKKILPIEFNKLLDMILSNSSYDIFPLNESILRKISEFKQLRDLHDRAILATAFELRVPLITKDSKLKDYGLVKIIW